MRTAELSDLVGDRNRDNLGSDADVWIGELEYFFAPAGGNLVVVSAARNFVPTKTSSLSQLSSEFERSTEVLYLLKCCSRDFNCGDCVLRVDVFFDSVGP